MSDKHYEYDVAVSFAGEDREYAEQCVNILLALGLRVFYDNYETDKLWGKELYSYFANIYSEKSKYVIIFISKEYKRKLWTKHELKFINERAFTSKDEYILPVQLDDTKINSIPITTGYIKDKSPLEVATLVAKKIDAKIDIMIMIEQLKYWLPDEYIIEVKGDNVHFSYLIEDFEAEYPLRLLMEMHKLDLLYDLFIATSIVPN